MHILSVLCIGWVLGIQVTCIILVSLYVQVFIPSVNEHCDHYLVVITCLIKPWFVSYLHPCLITLCLSHMHFMFSTYNDHGVLLCFRRFMFIWFKSFSASRFRCEWVLSLFPNSRLSLESVLGFCHEIAKGGDRL